MDISADLTGAAFTTRGLAMADPNPGVAGTIEDHCTDHSLTVQGADASGTLNVRFLGYGGGKVTVCRADQTVLSGIFSGCYFFSFMRAGQMHVAHVGTFANPAHELSIGAKDQWRVIANDPGVTEVYGFQPHLFEDAANYTEQPGWGMTGTFAAFTPAGVPYYVALSSTGGFVSPLNSTELQFREVRRLRLPRPWSMIQSEPAWTVA